MSKSQPYYFEDIAFQLELNLQTIRRELINLLDEYQFNDCFCCNRIKCRCLSGLSHSSFSSIVFSINSGRCSSRNFGADEGISEDQHIQAPPPESLPTPQWKEEKKVSKTDSVEECDTDVAASLDAWVRASILTHTSTVRFPVPKTIFDQINLSWPPFAKSIWSDEKASITSEMENRFSCESERASNNSVENFFRYFNNTHKKRISKQSCASR